MQQYPSMIGKIEDVIDDRYEEFCRIQIDGKSYIAHRYLVDGDPMSLKGKTVKLIANNQGNLLEILSFDKNNVPTELYKYSPEMIDHYDYIVGENSTETYMRTSDKAATHAAKRFASKYGYSLRYYNLDKSTPVSTKRELGIKVKVLPEDSYRQHPGYSFEDIEALEWNDAIKETAHMCYYVPLDHLYEDPTVQRNYNDHIKLAKSLPLARLLEK